MKAEGFSLTRFWNGLSIKYKIVIISASLITLRLFLNGNYFLGYQQLEKYHDFERQVHAASTELYNFKSSFTEIFFTNGALPQIEQSRQHLEQIITTFTNLHQNHGDEMMFNQRIVGLRKSAAQLKLTVDQVLQKPEVLTLGHSEGMIVLGRITAMSNYLFNDVHLLIDDVTLFSGQMRNEIFEYMLTMGMVIFSVGILFLIMLYRGVMGPLKLLEEMRNLIQRVRTEGDFSGKVRGDENNTEVGRLASDFNALISTLNTNLGKTSQTVNLVAEHVQRLSHEVRESHDEISQQQHEIFHLNNAIRKMAGTLQTLTDNAHKVARSAVELGNHCREGEGLMEQIRQSNLCLDEHINSAMQQLKHIQEGSEAGTSNTPAGAGSIHDAEGGSLFGNTLSQLQYYSKEAANSIQFVTTGLNQHRTTLESASRPATMIRQLSESIDECTQKILSTIETEKAVLQTISRDVDEISNLENHAAFTSKLITSASDELLYLSKLLSAEVQCYQTTYNDKPKESKPLLDVS